MALRHGESTEFSVYALSLIVVIIRFKPEVLGSVRGAGEY
jgi:hypothetical protein